MSQWSAVCSHVFERDQSFFTQLHLLWPTGVASLYQIYYKSTSHPLSSWQGNCSGSPLLLTMTAGTNHSAGAPAVISRWAHPEESHWAQLNSEENRIVNFKKIFRSLIWFIKFTFDFKTLQGKRTPVTIPGHVGSLGVAVGLDEGMVCEVYWVGVSLRWKVKVQIHNHKKQIGSFVTIAKSKTSIFFMRFWNKSPN